MLGWRQIHAMDPQPHWAPRSLYCTEPDFGSHNSQILIRLFDYSYPPTAAHLCLLLAVLCVPTTNDTGPGFISTTVENAQSSPPTQIILVEPSKLIAKPESADSSPYVLGVNCRLPTPGWILKGRPLCLLTSAFWTAYLCLLFLPAGHRGQHYYI